MGLLKKPTYFYWLSNNTPFPCILPPNITIYRWLDCVNANFHCSATLLSTGISLPLFRKKRIQFCSLHLSCLLTQSVTEYAWFTLWFSSDIESQLLSSSNFPPGFIVDLSLYKFSSLKLFWKYIRTSIGVFVKPMILIEYSLIIHSKLVISLVINILE